MELNYKDIAEMVYQTPEVYGNIIDNLDHLILGESNIIYDADENIKEDTFKTILNFHLFGT